MKHLLYTLAILLIAASCSNEETEQVMGQGKARLRFHVSTESPIVITRSTPVPTVINYTLRYRMVSVRL